MVFVRGIGKDTDQDFARCIMEKRACLSIADNQCVSSLLDEVSFHQDEDVIGYFKCQGSGEQGRWQGELSDYCCR
jgi:hypothetical protein